MKFKTYIFLAALCSYSFANCNLINGQVIQLMQLNKINGVAIAIIEPNNTNFCNYGYTNANKKYKINEHTLFEIASISKTFTATLAGIADTQGIIDLQKPINNYIIELKNNHIYSSINSQELLSHVSGLNFVRQAQSTQLNQKEFINTYNKSQIQYPPQTYYKYGNDGINLVGVALEKVYKYSFDNILQQQLLNKLHMDETFINIPVNYKNVATGYDQHNNPIPLFNTGYMASAAGLKSSPQDLAKYLKLQLNGSKDLELNNALNVVHKNYYCLYQDGTYQQLAWVYHPYNDLTAQFKPNTNNATNFKPQRLADNCAYGSNGFIEKTGNSDGMSLYILYMPSHGIGVVVLANKARVPDIVNLGRSILKQYDMKNKQ